MPPPLNRWDSARYACGLAVIVAGLAGNAAAQWDDMQPHAVALGALAGVCLAFLLVGIAARRLPPDLPFRRVDAAGRRAAAEPASPGLARLRLALGREPLAWSRMDIYVDGARIGQLRAGMAFVVPVRPGSHVLSARVWLRRVDFRESINALPGTDSDIMIRGSGSKIRNYGVERRELSATLRDERTILVHPAVMEA